MLKVVAKNYVKEENLSEFLNLAQELVLETKKENGSISYNVYQDETNSTILTFIEEWQTKECLNKHLSSKHFTKLIPLMSKLCTKEADMNIYNKLI